MILAGFIIFFIAIIIPEAAYAWGPATHLELGREILNNAGLLASPVRSLIENFPYDFLYGNISADIVVGKNLVEELKHCHNWKIGFRLLKKARTDAQRAFAYGYLCHLACDTVAHNNFIPEMMIRSFSTTTLRHIYWELRFDAFVDKSVWQIPKKMVKGMDMDDDALLDSVIEDTPLSFRTNKTIFSSVMTLKRFKVWHRMLGLVSNASRWKLPEEERVKYFRHAFDAAMGFLNHGHKAPCVRIDPTGKHSLNAAKFIRKKLKSARRQGRDWEGAMEKALNWVRL